MITYDFFGGSRKHFFEGKKVFLSTQKILVIKTTDKKITGSSTLADSQAIGVQNKKNYHKTSEVRIIVK